MRNSRGLNDYLDAVEAGRLSKSVDSTGRYVSFKYPQTTPYEGDWDEVTLTARGHVWDLETGELVGAPFDKFFNLNEHSEELSQRLESDERTAEFTSRWSASEILEAQPLEKLDGSMGLVWLDHEGEVRVNTPGSFSSDQAIWAQGWLAANPDTKDRIKDLLSGDVWLSLCVEIIYTSRPVVVRYEEEDFGLHLLGATVHPDRVDEMSERLGDGLWGRWASPSTLRHLSSVLGLRCAGIEQRSGEELIKLASTEGATGEEMEGWVFMLPDGRRVKVKCQDYVQAHRERCNVHVNRIREILIEEDAWAGGVQIDEDWDAVAGRVMRWVSTIDEEYRGPFEEFARALIDDVESQAKALEGLVELLASRGYDSPSLIGRAVATGELSLEYPTGKVISTLREGLARVDVKATYERLKILYRDALDEVSL